MTLTTALDRKPLMAASNTQVTNGKEAKMLVIAEEEKGKIPAQRRKENPGIEVTSWRSPSQFINNKNCRRRMRAKRVTKVLGATRYGDGDGDGS
jgi:hypothetical protein